MMVKKGKRKLLSITHSSSPPRTRKKSRTVYVESSDSSPSLSRSGSGESYYEARAILKERRTARRDVEYLVDWQDDRVTGKKFTPSWEPRTNVTAKLEAEWLERPSAPGPQLTSSQRRPPAPQRTTTRSGRGRPRRIIESSISGPQISSPPLPVSPSPSSRGPPRIVASSSNQPSVAEHPDQATQESITTSQLAELDASLHVIIPERHPESLAEYQSLPSFSQDIPSSFAPSLLGTAPQPDSPPRRHLASPRRRRFSLTAVIPDSQAPLPDHQHDSAEITSKVTFENSPDRAHQNTTNDVISRDRVDPIESTWDQPSTSPKAILDIDPVDDTSYSRPAAEIPSKTLAESREQLAIATSSAPPTLPEASLLPLSGYLASSEREPTQVVSTKASKSVSEQSLDILPLIESDENIHLNQDSPSTSIQPNPPASIRDSSLGPILNSPDFPDRQPFTPAFTSSEPAHNDVSSILESSPSVPRPPRIPESLDTQSFLNRVRGNMPDTRRSLKGVAPASSAGAMEETDSPVRKSLRGMRKEADLKRAEAKVKAQKLAEQKKNGAEQKPQRRSTSVPGSETGSSAATLARGRGRKLKTLIQDADGNTALTMPSELRENDEGSGKATNGDHGASPNEAAVVENGPQLTTMEFIVPLPLTGQAADQYRRTIVYQKKLIEDFTKSKVPSPELVAEAALLVQKMRDICLHIDLINETTDTQGEVTPAQQASWDRSCSSKFKFLSLLINVVHEHDVHIIMFARPGRCLDMLETFIQGSDVQYSRPDKQEKAPETDERAGLLMTLLPSQGEGSKAVVESADLMISLDLGLDVNTAHIRALRRNGNNLTPVITLTVINSIDHIDRCMSSNWNEVERLLAEVSCITKLRTVAGKMDSEYQTIDDSATLIGDFVLQDGNQADWPIAPIGPLEDNEAWDIAMGHFLPSDSDKALGQKRSRDSSMELDGPTVKKVRVNSQNVGEISITRISDSVTSQAQNTGFSPEDTTALRDTIKAVEDRAQATIRDKDNTARERERRLQEIERDFDLQMNRFEDQSFKLRGLQTELEDAKTALEDSRTLRQRREETISVLKEENNNLKAQLTEARSALENGLVPEVAELERLRREKEEAELGRQKSEKDLANERSLGSYLRAEYSTASSRAMELGAENEDLLAQVNSLSKKANGEAVRLKQMNLDTQTTMTMREIDRLKLELKNKDQIIKRNQEELQKKRAGVGTRAGSVPRSPRVGPASRGGSPIPDRRIEAVKNNMSFSGRKLKQPPAPPAEDPAPRTSQTATFQSSKETKHAPESKLSEVKPVLDSRLLDIQPAQQRPPVDVKGGLTPSRPFPCCFAQFNCHASFTSKNEWKRHISTKHIQLGFWRCDMCNPSPGLDHPVYNDFNRKDLFTQHLRRMHAAQGGIPITPQSKDGQLSQPSTPTSASAGAVLSEEAIADIQKRCYRVLRTPPQQSSCVFCPRVFTGANSWEERLEHVGGHLERDRKNGTNCLDIAAWRDDEDLTNYLVREGIVETDPRGGWRIGDGRPRRAMDIPPPTPSANAGTTHTHHPPHNHHNPLPTAGTDVDSESSAGKRRRGRPPKRYSETESPLRLAPNVQPPPNSLPEMQPRASQQPLLPAPLDLRDVAPNRPMPLQPRGLESAPSTPQSGTHHPRLEPYPPPPPPPPSHSQPIPHPSHQQQHIDGGSGRSQQNILPRLLPLTPQPQHANQGTYQHPPHSPFQPPQHSPLSSEHPRDGAVGPRPPGAHIAPAYHPPPQHQHHQHYQPSQHQVHGQHLGPAPPPQAQGSGQLHSPAQGHPSSQQPLPSFHSQASAQPHPVARPSPQPHLDVLMHGPPQPHPTMQIQSPYQGPPQSPLGLVSPGVNQVPGPMTLEQAEEARKASRGRSFREVIM